jgi:lipoprotein-anchoring transpeptidase ErfK/SrfK
MGGTGRQVLDRPARLTPGDRPAQAPRDRPAQARSRLRFRTRLDQTAAVAALVAVTAMIAAVAAAKSSGAGPAPARQQAPAAVVTANAVPAITRPGHGSVPRPVSPAAAPVPRAAAPLALTAADHQDCPAAATACVDLTRHITWLQAGRRVTFGPVQMEPGKPGSQHQTPRGTFQVAWKAGPSYQSNTYHEPMPWATFFAVGGIAFHGGSLTAWSHGCVHMTDTNAHYYNEHLPIGAEVVVF